MTWSSTNSFHQSDWDEDDRYNDECLCGDYDARSDLDDDGPRFVSDDDARMRGWRPDPAVAPPPVALPHNSTDAPEGTTGQASANQQNVMTAVPSAAIVNPWRHQQPPPPQNEPPPAPPPPPPQDEHPLRRTDWRVWHGTLWAPPSDHLYNVMRLNWTPQVGQMMIPYRLVDQIVWARSIEGQDGIGQVLSTYDVVDRIEHTMSRADCMEVFAINDQLPGAPIMFWRPMWVSWMPGAPHPVWIVRWLTARY